MRYFSPSKSAGAVSLDVGIQQTVQVRGIAPELFQVAVCLIAGEGRRHHKRGMAEQIVLHVRLVDDLVFRAVEDAPDQLFIGDCTRQLSDGDLFQVDGDHPVNLPMPAESAKANRTFFSGSAAASALACTLFPTKTMFLVRFARSVSRTESSCV